ncbi:hypothetical protein RHGRI_007549 [Rhododendron griersonianum]|uniref:Uncharacterized protein n=1 Tax=Rhododendron griersonianum TaxID=479676 RepID=A0AAV6KXG5_9ERIC|nr:hypothetical protein RHGRI_007549 [Rhododendron griersonianum]
MIGGAKTVSAIGGWGDVWKRFLKSTFPAELRSMNTITLPGAKRVGGCTELYRKYWGDNVVCFLEYVKGVPVSLEVEDVMSQDGELCLPKVKDPALALFGARSPYVKEEVLGRVKEHLKDIDGTLERDVGSSVSLSGQDREGQAKGLRLSGKHTSKRPAKDVVKVTKPGKRKKTSKGNEESSKVVKPGVVEEMVRIPRVEVLETEIGQGSEMPSNSLEGNEESSKVVRPDVIEEVVRTRVGVLETAAGGGLEVPLDSLEAIGTFDQNAAVHGVVNDIWGDKGGGGGGGSSRGVPHPWQGKSLRHMRSLVVVWSEEEEEEEMEEEEEGSEDNDRDDDQGDEAEGEEEAGLVGD